MLSPKGNSFNDSKSFCWPHNGGTMLTVQIRGARVPEKLVRFFHYIEQTFLWNSEHSTMVSLAVGHRHTQTHSLSKGPKQHWAPSCGIVKHSRNVLGSKLFCRNEKSFMLLAFLEWMCSTINISRTKRISFSFNEKWGLLLAGVHPILPHGRRNFPGKISHSPHLTVDHSGLYITTASIVIAFGQEH